MQILLKASFYGEQTGIEEQELPVPAELEKWWIFSIIFTMVWNVPLSLRQYYLLPGSLLAGFLSSNKSQPVGKPTSISILQAGSSVL